MMILNFISSSYLKHLPQFNVRLWASQDPKHQINSEEKTLHCFEAGNSKLEKDDPWETLCGYSFFSKHSENWC